MVGGLSTLEMKLVLHILETRNARTQFPIGFIKVVGICSEISKSHARNSHRKHGHNGQIGQKHVLVGLVEFIERENV